MRGLIYLHMSQPVFLSSKSFHQNYNKKMPEILFLEAMRLIRLQKQDKYNVNPFTMYYLLN